LEFGMPETLSIGELADAAGVQVTTVRFYERKGLLLPPPRRASGYRMYGGDAVQRLRFIQEAKELGFSLHEIAELLALRVGAGRTCRNVRQRAVHKIADMEARMQQLKRFRRALQKLVAQCEAGGTRGECPILDALEHPKTAPAAPRKLSRSSV
jgi:Hg(II)-responsive transcriptional regulator